MALLLLRLTAKPVEGAAKVSETVQEVLPGALIVVFVQFSPARAGAGGWATVIEPFELLAEIPVPFGSVATTAVS